MYTSPYLFIAHTQSNLQFLHNRKCQIFPHYHLLSPVLSLASERYFSAVIGRFQRRCPCTPALFSRHHRFQYGITFWKTSIFSNSAVRTSLLTGKESSGLEGCVFEFVGFVDFFPSYVTI